MSLAMFSSLYSLHLFHFEAYAGEMIIDFIRYFFIPWPKLVDAL